MNSLKGFASLQIMTSYLQIFSPDIILLFFRTAETMLEPSCVMYIYHGMCYNMLQNETICSNLGNYPKHQDLIQKDSAEYITLYRFLWNLPALALTLFCGSWSDRIGRKYIVIFPIIGTIISVTMYLVSTLKKGYYLPMVLIGAIIRGMFGGTAVLFMALQSYISDITTTENRTWRFGVLLAMNYFGNVLGFILMGLVLKLYSFAGIFCSVLILDFICVLWAFLFMCNKISPSIDPATKFFSLKNMCTLSHAAESFKVIFKKRDSGARKPLILLLIAVTINQIGREVESDILVLFVERRPLNWDKSMYGYLAAVDFGVMGILVCFVLPILSYRFCVPDIYLILLGVGGKVIRLFLLAFAKYTWMVYVAVLAGSFISMSISAIKSLLSKLIETHETGKLFSMVSFGETLSSLLGSLIFSNLYAAYASTLPGLPFILTAILYMILAVLMIYLSKSLFQVTVYEEFEDDVNSDDDKSTCDSMENINSLNNHLTNIKSDKILEDSIIANTDKENRKLNENHLIPSYNSMKNDIS